MRNTRSAASARGGFTLVEMLIAVALVMLMMVMFASMFGTAVGTMRRQRALANNDQKARALTALLRSDLEAATYKSQLYSDSPGLVPLVLGDVVDPNQKGYFYIAENDPASDGDDNLQFTIWVQEPISGRAQLIGQPDGDGAFTADPADLNQPDGDDGILGNGVTWSRAAEVSYFLRSGTLYRRVLLLRDPLPHNPVYPTQPTMGVAGEGTDAFSAYADRLLPGMYDADADQDELSGGTIGDFWNDFDSSVAWVPLDTDGDGAPDALQYQFHSIDSLDNNRGFANRPLGLPQHRFGHDPGLIAAGQPLEFLTTLPPAPQYIGRFTHEETSSPAFSYPNSGNDPFSYEDGTGHTLLNGDVVEYANGPRAGEDIVMSGVEAFNIEVLDEGWSLSAADRSAGGFPQFVNLGADLYPDGNAGDFAIDRNLNRDDGTTTTGYGYHTTFTSISLGDDIEAGNRFDTWHALAAVGSSLPPYRSLYTAISSPTAWVAGDPDPMVTPSSYAQGDIVFPAAGSNLSIAYICTNSFGSGEPSYIEPEWPRTPGAEFVDAIDASNGVIWRAVDNRIGLKMIRITIRYVDGQTGGLRQLTTYHSFVESR